MARHVFFSFHYDQDIWRVSQVRNSWVTKEWEPNKPIDKAVWETVKRGGDAAVKRWINEQLAGCGVTVVLIGQYTCARPYVLYEIERSHAEKKGMLGIYIHNLHNISRQTSSRGGNPFSQFSSSGQRLSTGGTVGNATLASVYPTYEWVGDRGYENFTSWVEQAARAANR